MHRASSTLAWPRRPSMLPHRAPRSPAVRGRRHPSAPAVLELSGCQPQIVSGATVTCSGPRKSVPTHPSPRRPQSAARQSCRPSSWTAGAENPRCNCGARRSSAWMQYFVAKRTGVSAISMNRHRRRVSCMPTYSTCTPRWPCLLSVLNDRPRSSSTVLGLTCSLSRAPS